jgi:hypothetical protein
MNHTPSKQRQRDHGEMPRSLITPQTCLKLRGQSQNFENPIYIRDALSRVPVTSSTRPEAIRRLLSLAIKF